MKGRHLESDKKIENVKGRNRDEGERLAVKGAAAAGEAEG